MTSKYWAGIGSRKVPDNIAEEMTNIAAILEHRGYKLRSGGADGSDKAFAKGIVKAENKQILRPKHATPESIKIASEIHPAWHHCNDYVRKLHGRNVQIILGFKLNKPASFVICWTKNASGQGGTGMGIKIAKLNNITVYDLGNAKTLNFILTSLKKSSGIFE